MITSEDDARTWLATVGECDQPTIDKLATFVDLLVHETARQNLIAATTIPAIWQRHIADSAQLLMHTQSDAETWLDVGTGAGFPGIVIAIMRPQINVHMVESRSLRAGWLGQAVSHLAIPNARVHSGRIETLSATTFATISARAFAPLDRLIASVARFSTSGTVWALPKGRSARDELHALSGWRHTFHVEQSLTDPDAGIIVGNLLGPKDRRR